MPVYLYKKGDRVRFKDGDGFTGRVTQYPALNPFTDQPDAGMIDVYWDDTSLETWQQGNDFNPVADIEPAR